MAFNSCWQKVNYSCIQNDFSPFVTFEIMRLYDQTAVQISRKVCLQHKCLSFWIRLFCFSFCLEDDAHTSVINLRCMKTQFFAYFYFTSEHTKIHRWKTIKEQWTQPTTTRHNNHLIIISAFGPVLEHINFVWCFNFSFFSLLFFIVSCCTLSLFYFQFKTIFFSLYVSMRPCFLQIFTVIAVYQLRLHT